MQKINERFYSAKLLYFKRLEAYLADYQQQKKRGVLPLSVVDRGINDKIDYQPVT